MAKMKKKNSTQQYNAFKQQEYIQRGNDVMTR